MINFVPTQTAKDFLEDKYNTNTIFSNSQISASKLSLKKKITNSYLYLVEKLLGRELLVTDFSYHYGYSVEIINTLNYLSKQEILGDVQFYKIENFNLYRVYCSFKNSKFVNGSDGLGIAPSKNEAFQKSIGELMERYDSFFQPKIYDNSLLSDFSSLKNAINPQDFNYFNNYTDGQKIHWIRGFNYQNQSVYLPTAICYNPKFQDPFFCEVSSSGVAAWNNYQTASDKAILELIERDSFLCHWLLKISPPRIELNSISDPEIQFYIKQFQKAGSKVFILNITTELNIPTIAILIYFTNSDFFKVTASSGFDLKKLILKSFQDIVAFSCFYKNKSEKKIYPDSIIDINGYWDNLENQSEHLKFFLQDGEEITYNSFDNFCLQNQVNNLAEFLHEKNVNIFLIDLTSNVSKSLGLNITRAVSPDLIQMFWGRKNSFSQHPRLTQFANFHQIKNPSINPIHHPFY